MGRSLYFLTLIWVFLFISACSDPDGSVNMQADTGGYSFHLVFPEDDSDTEAAADGRRSSLAIDCLATGVNTITVTIFNSANVQQATGSWSCSAHEGYLENIPPGSGYWVDCQGKDLSGTIIYRGQDTGITITAGVVTIGNEVEMQRIGDDSTPSTDTTPPTISSVSPLQGSTGVSTTVGITAVFSEAMDAATINAAAFVLNQGVTAIPGTVTYSGGTATFTPASNLMGGTTYTATVKTSVTDIAGNAMGSEYSWSFTTAVEDIQDVTPPTISSVSPSQDATGVSTMVDITAVFSEAMDSATINTAAFVLNQGATAISGTVTYSGQTATFNPTANLLDNTTYTATVKMSVTDIAGNAMSSDYSWSFTTGSPPDTITNTLGMTFQYIAAGTFWMGSPDTEVDRESDEIRHQVTLTSGFYMQTTEVTQGQWEEVMGSNPSFFTSCGGDCPVEQVSWDDVQSFLTAINQREEGIYRLPTEAEWEFCARAGTDTPFNTGACLLTDQANYNGNNPYTGCAVGIDRAAPIAVGSFDANAWGLYDMHGNVWEWCADWYGAYPTGAVTDPIGPLSGSFRVLRGGSWSFGARSCRSAIRGNVRPSGRFSDDGFRLVLLPGQ